MYIKLKFVLCEQSVFVLLPPNKAMMQVNYIKSSVHVTVASYDIKRDCLHLKTDLFLSRFVPIHLIKKCFRVIDETKLHLGMSGTRKFYSDPVTLA